MTTDYLLIYPEGDCDIVRIVNGDPDADETVDVRLPSGAIRTVAALAVSVLLCDVESPEDATLACIAPDGHRGRHRWGMA